MTTDLATVDRLEAAIQATTDPEQLGRILDAAKAAQRQRRHTEGELVRLAAIVLRASYQLGQILPKLTRGEGGKREAGNSMLRAVGLTKMQSSRLQELGRIPEEKFGQYVTDAMAKDKPPTMAGAKKAAGINPVEPDPRDPIRKAVKKWNPSPEEFDALFRELAAEYGSSIEATGDEAPPKGTNLPAGEPDDDADDLEGDPEGQDRAVDEYRENSAA